MRTVLAYPDSICIAQLPARSKSNMELSCFFILASFCCDSPEGRNISGTRHGLSMRRPYVRRLGTKEDVRQKRGMKARIMVDTCKMRARREDLESSLAGSEANISVGSGE